MVKDDRSSRDAATSLIFVEVLPWSMPYFFKAICGIKREN